MGGLEPPSEMVWKCVSTMRSYFFFFNTVCLRNNEIQKVRAVVFQKQATATLVFRVSWVFHFKKRTRPLLLKCHSGERLRYSGSEPKCVSIWAWYAFVCTYIFGAFLRIDCHVRHRTHFQRSIRQSQSSPVWACDFMRTQGRAVTCFAVSIDALPHVYFHALLLLHACLSFSFLLQLQCATWDAYFYYTMKLEQ